MSDNPTSPAIRLLGGIQVLLQFACGALFVAPFLLTMALQHFGMEAHPNETAVRIAGFVGVITFGLGRFLLPGGNPAVRRRQNWSEFANATGGAFTIEKRDLKAGDWTGGATVRWQIQGVEVKLTQVRASKSSTTRMTASFPTGKDLTFSILPNNFLTRAVTSQKFVGMIQANIVKGGGNSTIAPADRESAAKQIGVLAGSTVTLGDARLDGRVILKANDADLARYVLGSGGVGERLNTLLEQRKGCTVTLFTGAGGATSQLAIDLFGADPSREVLAAGRDFFEVLLGSLKQHGVIGSGVDSGDRRAAR